MEISEDSLFERLTSVPQLYEGWLKVLSNAGGPGGDGESVHTFGAHAEANLRRLSEDILNQHYRPGPIRRTAIPKRSGGTRPLAIPCVRDRVVQSALHILLEPVLEPIFSDASFGYRPGRSVAQAVKRVQDLHRDGFRHVVDADIHRFFENVPHARLLERLQTVVLDPRIVKIVHLWLTQELDGRGLAQGSPISPILSNFYLDHLDDTLSGKGIRLVRFADDFVVLCRSAEIAGNALSSVRKILGDLGLELNIEKTRLIDFNRGFQFLGKMFVKSMVFAGQEELVVDLGKIPPEPGPNLQATPYSIATPAVVAPELPRLDKFDPIPLEERGDPIPRSSWSPGERHPIDVHDLSPILRPVYLLTPGRRLSVRGEGFAVFEDDDVVALLAPSRIGRVEIGPDCEVDSMAIRHALDWNIEIAFVTHGGATRGVVKAPEDRATIHLAQGAARLEPGRCLAIAVAFADARTRNQRALLQRLNRRRKDEAIGEVATRIGRIARKFKIAATVAAVRGIEGEAAALYWPSLGKMMENGFSIANRTRQPPETPTDLLLSMAAATLTRDVGALLLRHGLHSGISFLHEPRDGESPLAWDFVEPFRAPLVEGLVVYLVNNRIISLDHIGRNPDGLWSISPEGRERFVRAYEAWLNRPIRNRRTGGESVWRGIIEDDILAFRQAIQKREAFDPYIMDY